MLENLRDKIINVQQDLSASFRNLASGQGQPYKGKKQGCYKGITLNAGGDLLHHYQQEWEEFHKDDTENAKKAEVVDELIRNLHSYCQEQLLYARQLNIQLCALPKLQANITDLMGKIGELEGMFEEVEDALINLEDVIETQELQERQLDHRFQLAMYKEKRLADFENYKAKLAQEHSQKVLEFERKQQVILKERQHAFQEAFEEEVQIFKTQGIKKLRERISSGSSAENPVSLESIDLADDSSALDEFLGSKEVEKDSNATDNEDSSEAELVTQDSKVPDKNSE